MTLQLLLRSYTAYFFITINLFFIIKYQIKLSTIGFTQNLDNAHQTKISRPSEKVFQTAF